MIDNLAFIEKRDLECPFQFHKVVEKLPPSKILPVYIYLCPECQAFNIYKDSQGLDKASNEDLLHEKNCKLLEKDCVLSTDRIQRADLLLGPDYSEFIFVHKKNPARYINILLYHSTIYAVKKISKSTSNISSNISIDEINLQCSKFERLNKFSEYFIKKLKSNKIAIFDIKFLVVSPFKQVNLTSSVAGILYNRNRHKFLKIISKQEEGVCFKYDAKCTDPKQIDHKLNSPSVNMWGKKIIESLNSHKINKEELKIEPEKPEDVNLETNNISDKTIKELESKLDDRDQLLNLLFKEEIRIYKVKKDFLITVVKPAFSRFDSFILSKRVVYLPEDSLPEVYEFSPQHIMMEKCEIREILNEKRRLINRTIKEKVSDGLLKDFLDFKQISNSKATLKEKGKYKEKIALSIKNIFCKNETIYSCLPIFLEKEKKIIEVNLSKNLNINLPNLEKSENYDPEKTLVFYNRNSEMVEAILNAKEDGNECIITAISTLFTTLLLNGWNIKEYKKTNKTIDPEFELLMNFTEE